MNQNEATADQLLAVGFMGLCCLLVGVVGFIGVIVWMMRSQKANAVQARQVAPPPVTSAPPPVQAAAEFHLSVIALAFDGYFRGQVNQVLSAASVAMDPVGQRVELVQRTARALLGVEAQWRFFGYGEKDLRDLTEAQQSYTSALDDFRNRSALPGDGGALTVLTLILCTRGPRLGVDRLDTRQQIHSVLEDRLRIDPTSLLGAEILWAPSTTALSEVAVRERFPEMQLVNL